jgi:TPR repeat protein
MKYLVNSILIISFNLILNSKILAASTSSTFCDPCLGVSTDSIQDNVVRTFNSATELVFDGLMRQLSSASKEGVLLTSKELDLLQVSDDEDTSREIYNLGVRFQLGLDIAHNLERAYRLFLLAASLGHAGALNNLGVMHYQEESVMYNPEFTLKCCTKAADMGLAEADYNLGLYYWDQLYPNQDLYEHLWGKPYIELILGNVLFHIMRAAKRKYPEAILILKQWQKIQKSLLKYR